MEFRPCGPENAEEIMEYLHPIWHEVFDDMIAGGAEAAEYIFTTWTNPEAIRESMAAGYEWGYAYKDGERLGLYSFHLQDDGRFYINKVYFEPRFRGRGLGNEALLKMTEIAREAGCTQMYLNVYYANERARRAYERAGFDHCYRCLQNIGGGVTRNDYVYYRFL
ncbi:MAG: GNAT family N-acetyltransferase [archaeon]|nr:GNAT family N-acetyltransferase [archaeon]